MQRITLFFLLIGCGFLPAQTVQWLNGGDNTARHIAQDIIMLPDGGTLVAGYAVSGTHVFPPLTVTSTPANFSSIILARTDANGQYQWVSTVVDSATELVSIAQMSSTSVVIAAQIQSGPLDLGNGVTVANPAGFGLGTLLAKYDLTTGLAQWGKIIPGTASLGGLTVDGGMIYLTGQYTQNFSIDGISLPDGPMASFTSIENGYIAQFDSTGTATWAKHMASLANPSVTNFAFVHPSGITTISGTVYVAGEHQENAQIGNFFLNQSTGAPFDSTDIFVAAYTSTGNELWARSSIGSSYQGVTGFDATSDGKLVISGIQSSDFDFGGGTVTDAVGPYGKSYVLQLTPTGFYEWHVTCTQQLSTIATREDQAGIFVGGYFDSTGVTSTFTLSDTTFTLSFSRNLFVAKLDSAGSVDWFSSGEVNSTSFFGAGISTYGAKAISLGTQGQVAVCGDFKQFATWGGISINSAGNAFDHLALVMDDSTWIAPPFPTDSVWPGDTDYDLVANNADLLPIGLAFGSTGTTRPNASLTWVGQPCYDWAGALSSGVNYKHSDTDGNGLVNDDDTLAILQNYGLIHQRPSDANRNGALLYPEFLDDSLSVGDTAHIAINLGTDTMMAEDVYGLAFTLNFDTSLVDFGSLQVNYDNSWLGTKGSDLLTLHKDFPGGQLDMALVRNDQVERDGNGNIAHVIVIMVDDLTAKTELAELLQLEITSIKAIDGLGIDLSLSSGQDSLVLTQAIEDTTIGDTTPVNIRSLDKVHVHLYPQPATQSVQISLTGATATGWRLIDLTGRQVSGQTRRFTRTEIPLSTLGSGVYLLELPTDQGLLREQLIVR